jgi:4-hydroxythreonine-4-phosphate dehydrogenase
VVAAVFPHLPAQKTRKVIKQMAYKPVIAITVGDPSGIGPEIAKKAACDPTVLRLCRPVVFGCQGRFRPGIHARKNDSAVITNLTTAIDLIKRNKADALVTGPAAKSAFGKNGGHTEFLKKITGSGPVEMLMIAGDLRVLLLTRHVPIKDVSRHISASKIVTATTRAAEFIRKHFLAGKRSPSVAVCGLNPHLSDHGLIGNEEQTIIKPAVAELQSSGIDAAGPVLAETAFAGKRSRPDLIVCLYHDQAMLPLKLLKPDKIVNLTIGLPFIRTSPGHGTAYDIAGKGIAHAGPFIEAVKLACYLTKRRQILK